MTYPRVLGFLALAAVVIIGYQEFVNFLVSQLK
jgi:hypothetical protein